MKIEIQEVMDTLEKLSPGIVDENFTNPFLYTDIKDWHRELKERLLKSIKFAENEKEKLDNNSGT